MVVKLYTTSVTTNREVGGNSLPVFFCVQVFFSNVSTGTDKHFGFLCMCVYVSDTPKYTYAGLHYTQKNIRSRAVADDVK